MNKSKRHKNTPRQPKHNSEQKVASVTGTPTIDHQQHTNSESNKPKQERNAKKENEQMGWLKRKWEFVRDPQHSGAVVAIFTIVIACTGITYTVFAALQWSTMRDSMVSVQRPFIAFQGIAYEHHIRTDESGKHDTFVFAAKVENVGNTPSKPIAQNFDGAQLAGEPDEEKFASKSAVSSTVLAPRTPSTIGRGDLPFSTFFGADNPESVQNIRTRKFAEGEQSYFWGWITYRDNFPHTPIHLVEWCEYVYGVSAAPNPPNVGTPLAYSFDFSSCPHHNCNDEDCGDYKEMTSKRPK